MKTKAFLFASVGLASISCAAARAQDVPRPAPAAATADQGQQTPAQTPPDSVQPTDDASAAVADTTAAPGVAPQQAAGGGDIVVTGSRIRGTFNSPTPVTSIAQTDLQAAAPATLAEGLQQLPSITPGGGPSAGGGTAHGGQNFLNLRALGDNRTLILMNGRRLTPTGPDNLTDTNLIPQGLVQRVDVVTGGASAAYGSDAVAGVVNFVLDTHFTGLKLDLSSGISQRGDNSEQKIAVTAGTSLLNDRLHIIAAGEYYHSDGVPGDARDFRRMALNQLANPDGTPKLIGGDDLRTPYTPGGMVVIGQGGTAAANGQILGIMFGAGGTPMPYDYGTIASDIGKTSGSQNGGDGFRVSTGQEIARPLVRKTLYGRAEYDVSDNVHVFGEGTYGYSLSDFLSSPVTRTLTIDRSNPYLAQADPALVAQMTALGVTGFQLNRLFTEQPQNHTANKNQNIRGLGGFTGTIAGNWDWDVSYQYGRDVNDAPMYENLIVGNLNQAVNTTTSGGQIVCAGTVSADPAARAAAAGCAPLNPFGAGSPSQQSLDYVFGTSQSKTTVTQQVADANVSGTLFALPAGPLKVAVGGEWRKITARTVADPLSQAGAFRLVNQQNFFGTENVKEAYGELDIPILKNAPLAKSLGLNLAGRHTDYSTSGGVNTWKVGVSWQVVDSIRFRATRSRDIRAPDLSELFATGRQNNITIDDTLFTGRTYFSVPNKTLGNPDLKPEVANTWVAGVVLQPSFLPSFNLAVDYYDIKIDDAITNVGGNDAVQQCNLSNQTSALCDFVIRDASTQAVIGTLTSPANLAQQVTRGVDIEAGYKVPLDSLFGGDPGDLHIRALASYVAENKTSSPLLTVVYDDAGNGTASLPHWRGNLVLNYDRGQFSAFTQVRYIGAMTWDKSRVLGVDTDFNHINPQVYVDSQFSVHIPAFGHDQTIFLNVHNLLDKKPPYDPGVGGATPLPTDPNLFDQVGRMFRIGVNLQF
ncbi:TonB-dependent receptor [Sphingomonas koreensis]|nr:TonB-dependent receptor [Sphingomonas koreensis]